MVKLFDAALYAQIAAAVATVTFSRCRLLAGDPQKKVARRRFCKMYRREPDYVLQGPNGWWVACAI